MEVIFILLFLGFISVAAYTIHDIAAARNLTNKKKQISLIYNNEADFSGPQILSSEINEDSHGAEEMDTHFQAIRCFVEKCNIENVVNGGAISSFGMAFPKDIPLQAILLWNQIQIDKICMQNKNLAEKLGGWENHVCRHILPALKSNFHIDVIRGSGANIKIGNKTYDKGQICSSGDQEINVVDIESVEFYDYINIHPDYAHFREYLDLDETNIFFLETSRLLYCERPYQWLYCLIAEQFGCDIAHDKCSKQYISSSMITICLQNGEERFIHCLASEAPQLVHEIEQIRLQVLQNT